MPVQKNAVRLRPCQKSDFPPKIECQHMLVSLILSQNTKDSSPQASLLALRCLEYINRRLRLTKHKRLRSEGRFPEVSTLAPNQSGRHGGPVSSPRAVCNISFVAFGSQNINVRGWRGASRYLPTPGQIPAAPPPLPQTPHPLERQVESASRHPPAP